MLVLEEIADDAVEDNEDDDPHQDQRELLKIHRIIIL